MYNKKKPALTLNVGSFLFMYICNKNNELYFDQGVNRYIVPLINILHVLILTLTYCSREHILKTLHRFKV